jgi:aryl-alcohol dehydrogenase-like predicted oxidoreductase
MQYRTLGRTGLNVSLLGLGSGGATGNLMAPSDLRTSLEKSLRALRTDFVDVFYLHGIAPARYMEVWDQFLPELTAAKQEGLIDVFGPVQRNVQPERVSR